jgi:hypothetical protein
VLLIEKLSWQLGTASVRRKYKQLCTDQASKCSWHMEL